MAAAETISEQEYKISPVRWGGTRMPFGMREGSRLEEVRNTIDRRGPSCISELRSIAADDAESSGARYEALGYLVAFQNREGRSFDSKDLVDFLEQLARSAEKRSHWQSRQDALGALAHLRDDVGTHPLALAKLIELANDATFKYGRHDALLALGMTRDPKALESLASGVIEYGELNAIGRSEIADCVSSIMFVPWPDKARVFVQLLQQSSRQRNEIHPVAILQAIKPPEERPQHTQEAEDFFIGEALRFEQDDRMSGIFAELIAACEGGDTEQAGHRINAYQRNHSLPSTALRNLRVQLGGTPAVSGVMTILKPNLDKYFQEPIHQLNEDTRKVWQKALANATTGYVARLWMSITVFALGVLLVCLSSYKIFLGEATRASLLSFAAGLGTMLLIVYVGPLKEIRQSVNDLASANAAFMAYVHRILEASHTFSYYYLTEKISFEEMQKSSQIIGQAMDNTIRALNTEAIDSAEDVIRRAIAAGRDQEKRNTQDGHNGIAAPDAVSDTSGQDRAKH